MREANDLIKEEKTVGEIYTEIKDIDQELQYVERLLDNIIEVLYPILYKEPLPTEDKCEKKEEERSTDLGRRLQNIRFKIEKFKIILREDILEQIKL